MFVLGLPCLLPLLQVRVYVNGQLAGFTPIYYTMYTVSARQTTKTQVLGSSSLAAYARRPTSRFYVCIIFIR
jgi:hypothetical protein